MTDRPMSDLKLGNQCSQEESATSANELGAETTPVADIPIMIRDDSRQMQARPDISNVQYGSFCQPTGDKSLAEIIVGYRRCFDFDPTNGTGQDFAAVRANEDHIVAIVADGVSQSFFGDIAARRVSLFLLDALWRGRANPPSEKEIEDGLLHLEKEVAREVGSYELAKKLPEMQLAALEKARVRGSQTVFAAFVLDLSTSAAVFYQLGDVAAIIRLIGNNVSLTSGNSAGRWSSAGNSRLLIKIHRFHSCEGALLKSDGAGDAWGQNLEENGAIGALEFQQLTSEQAAKDDVAFVAVRFGSPIARRSGQASGRSANLAATTTRTIATSSPAPSELRGTAQGRSSDQTRDVRRYPSNAKNLRSSPTVDAENTRPKRSLLTARDLYFLILGLLLGLALAVVAPSLILKPPDWWPPAMSDHTQKGQQKSSTSEKKSTDSRKGDQKNDAATPFTW